MGMNLRPASLGKVARGGKQDVERVPARPTGAVGDGHTTVGGTPSLVGGRRAHVRTAWRRLTDRMVRVPASGSGRMVLHALVPGALVAGWALAIDQIRISQISDVGLIAATPRVVLILLAALSVSFAVALGRRPLHSLVPLAHVVVLVVMLYGITAFVEPVPRFATVYEHVGIIGYILGHGSVDPHIDAYFNWPGFFALGSLITKLAGWHSALPLAAWGPLLFNLLYLPPLYAIFAWGANDARVTWLGLWVFYCCNWVAQDYLSPQATGFLMWLTMLAVLLRWFTPRPAGLAPARAIRAVPRTFGLRGLGAVPADGPPLTGVQTGGLLALVLVIYGATVSGHQLTPVPMILTVAALVVFAGLQTRMLPVIMAVGLAAWISYMTTAWLAGHFSTLSGSLGSLGQSVGQGVGSRVVGSSGHELIVDLRLVFSGAVWALAAAGFLRRRRLRRSDVALAVTGLTPFLLPALQPYGGEILLRVFLFALPAAAFFTACLVFPSWQSGLGRRTLAAVAIGSCLLLAGFQYARYGNERLDAFTRGDVAAVDALSRLAPRGAKLVAANGNIPWRYQGYAAYDYMQLSDWHAWLVLHPQPAELLDSLQLHLGASGGYFIVTRSTEISAHLLESKAAALERFVAYLRHSPAADQLYHRGQAAIFRIRGADF